jgi:hypothetical protein
MAMQSEHTSRQMDETTARREFLSRIGKTAVTAPAVALLVAASAQPISAQGYRPSWVPGPPPRVPPNIGG